MSSHQLIFKIHHNLSISFNSEIYRYYKFTQAQKDYLRSWGHSSAGKLLTRQE